MDAPETPLRRSDKRGLISRAAIEVFAEKGFHQARVSDVAARAGVADGTIYLYFRSKDDLLLSIFEDSMDLLLKGVQAALIGIPDPLEKLRIFIRYHFTQVQEHKAVSEVLQVELRLCNKFLKDYRPEKLWAYLAVLAEIIREGKEKGVVRSEVDPFVQMWAIFGTLDELGMQWVLAKRKKFDLSFAAEQVAETFIRGFAAHPVALEES
jgi:TetR/AcrR family fatty acid metabolism transcriptional regulator